MKCERPDLQEALLSEARAGVARGSAYQEHLGTCEDCRQALEFLGQARQRWPQKLSPGELLQLRLRVLPRVREQQLGAARFRRAPRAAAIAIFGVSAVSLAALGSYIQLERQRAQQFVAPPVADSLPVPGQRPRPEPSAPPLALAPAGKEQATEEPPLRATGPRKDGSSKLAATGLWSDAADALKRDDLPGAERALTQLSADRDRTTRDSAALSLAEIWIKQGHATRARGALGRLAQSGATPTIRERARTLLGSLGR